MTFEQAIKIILKFEGGYVNDPNDLGGETNFGISKRQFPNEDIKNMTVDRAKFLYWTYYWNKMKIDSIDNGLLQLHLFDMGVNAGPQTAVKLLQEIIGQHQDGYIGPFTLQSIKDYPDQTELSQRYALMRLAFYQKKTERNPNLKRYLKGWQNRVNLVSKECAAV